MPVYFVNMMYVRETLAFALSNYSHELLYSSLLSTAIDSIR